MNEEQKRAAFDLALTKLQAAKARVDAILVGSPCDPRRGFLIASRRHRGISIGRARNLVDDYDRIVHSTTCKHRSNNPSLK